jgi:hypothetical protein
MKRTRQIAILTALAGLTVTHAPLAVADMKAIGSSDNAVYYVDTDTLKRTGDVRTFWSIMDYKKTQTTSRGASYLSTRTNMEINCKDQTVLMRQFSMHSGAMAKGDVLDTQGILRDAQAIPPGTPLFNIMRAVC